MALAVSMSEEIAALTIEVRAPSAGTVIEILTKAGAKVAVDDDLLLVESMKMHIPVSSPVAGTVAQITVSEGSQVSEDDVLAVIEP